MTTKAESSQETEVTATEATEQTTTAAPPETKEAPAPAPAASETKEGEKAAPKTPLEAAKRVMAQEEKQASEKSKTESTQPPPAAADKPKDGVTAEEDEAKLPFKDHPKWKEISSQNRILKVAKEKNEAAIAELTPKAKTHEDLHSYLTENRLSADDFRNMLTIGAAMRNDPFAAYDMLLPIMQQLEGIVGVRLPADLQAQVTAGQVTPEVASELARTRAARAAEEDRRKHAEEVAQAARDREAQSAEERVGGEVVASFNAWEKDWKARDPDYDKKLPLVMRTLEASWGKGEAPRSPEEARQQAERALEEVNKHLSGIISIPQPKSGILPPGGGATTTARPIPQSSIDAARAAIGGAR